MRFCDKCHTILVVVGVAPDGTDICKCPECGCIE